MSDKKYEMRADKSGQPNERAIIFYKAKKSDERAYKLLGQFREIYSAKAIIEIIADLMANHREAYKADFERAKKLSQEAKK